MIDADYLRGLGGTKLARLLELRPDLLFAPAVESLGELAERLATIGSVISALRRLDRPTLQAAEAAAALGGDVDRSVLARLLGNPAPEALDAALRTLADHALVADDALVADGARIILVPLARSAFGRPLGLGIPLAEALDRRTATELKVFARNLMVSGGNRKTDILAAIIAALRDANHVNTLVDAAPTETSDLLRRIAQSGENIDAYAYGYGSYRHANPYTWAIERAMLTRGEWGEGLSMPAEVTLALRGPTYTAPFNPVRPTVDRVAAQPVMIDRSAAAAGAALVRLSAGLLSEASRAPLTTLKSGGIGVRELRRLAKLLTVSENEINLCVDLVTGYDLLAITESHAAPTSAYDAWMREEPVDQLVPLIETWWRLPYIPLSQERDDPGGSSTCFTMRSAVLAEIAREPSAITDPDQLATAVIWRQPAAFGSAETARERVVACWHEAALLGLTGAGAISEAGRALLAGGDIAGTFAGVGSSERTVRLQADLTAVVPGAPAPDLADLLDLMADQESRGAAGIWRFSPASIRRALDAGHRVPDLRDRLSAVATGGLPQTLTYLLDDVARRHGVVRASTVGCCLRSDDTTLLAEIERDKRLRKLGLRLLAPTVLAAEAPIVETLTALRAAGYAPVTEGPDGQTVVELRRAARVGGPASTTPTQRPGNTRRPATTRSAPVAAPTAAAVAERLLAAADDATASVTPVFAALRTGSSQLTNAEIRMLAWAIEQRQPIEIGYINNAGNGSVRIIEDIEFTGGSLSAWCRLREDNRWFTLNRIVTVEPVVAGAHKVDSGTALG